MTLDPDDVPDQLSVKTLTTLMYTRTDEAPASTVDVARAMVDGSRQRRQRRLLPALSAVVVLALAASVAVAMHPHRSTYDGSVPVVAQSGTAEDQVRAAFTNAVRISQGLPVPLVDVVGDKPTEAQLQRQATDGAAAVRAAFAEAPAAQVLIGLDNAITSQRQDGDNLRILGAGIGNVSFDQVAIMGNRAQVRAHVETWSRTQVRQPGGEWTVAEPHNVVDVTMELARNPAGAWIVEVYQWQFASGSGP